MAKHDSDQANFSLGNLALQLIVKSSAVNIFLWLLFVVGVFLLVLTFTSKINPWASLVAFIAIVCWILDYLFGLLSKRSDLFQNSQTWLGYQKLLLGSKQTGLQELLPKTELLQPVIQKRTNSAKANIAKPKRK